MGTFLLMTKSLFTLNRPLIFDLRGEIKLVNYIIIIVIKCKHRVFLEIKPKLTDII